MESLAEGVRAIRCESCVSEVGGLAFICRRCLNGRLTCHACFSTSMLCSDCLAADRIAAIKIAAEAAGLIGASPLTGDDAVGRSTNKSYERKARLQELDNKAAARAATGSRLQRGPKLSNTIYDVLVECRKDGVDASTPTGEADIYSRIAFATANR